MKVSKHAIILVALCFIVIGCAAQNQYSVNLTIEEEVTVLTEQYNLWYNMMDPDVQAEWSPIFDPVFLRIDQLLDTYHAMVANGMSAQGAVLEINRLKTVIMMELIKRKAVADEG